MKNQVQLITYVDRLGGRRDGQDLARLRRLLCEAPSPLAGLFGGVHLLPFFDAIDGADAGFDPTDHTQVDPRLGQWADVKALTEQIDVMGDVIVNHISSASPQFLDYSAKGRESAYDGLFLTYDAVFPQGATEQDLLRIYRPRPGLPFSSVTLASGERRLLWTTFTAAQIDIAVRHPQGLAYLDGILRRFSENGIRMVRLDAVGYAIKQAGQSCFMMAETFTFIGEFAARARALGMEVLVEVHAYHQRQIEIACQVDWVYDFALPPLVLHAFAFKTATALKRWIAIRPTNALTVLDTHDGIGIIDIGADPADRIGSPGLVPPDELDALVERIHEASGGQSRLATGAAASNLDLYQVNCTYFDALGGDETAYLLARALQFFLPGIPQVYYVGLLAGANDMDLLAHSQVGRDINRHVYDEAEVLSACERPVVRRLLALIRLRNQHPAFAGRFSQQACDDDSLVLRWEHDGHWASLSIDFSTREHRLSYSAGAGATQVFDFGACSPA